MNYELKWDYMDGQIELFNIETECKQITSDKQNCLMI